MLKMMRMKEKEFLFLLVMKQNGIPIKIIINSIDDGYEEIFSASGDPPFFTKDEV